MDDNLNSQVERGKKYELRTFNGTMKPSQSVNENEDYWKLIGHFGVVLHFAEDLGFHNNDRVLVRFETDVFQKGLESHNKIPNSLWILKTDLK